MSPEEYLRKHGRLPPTAREKRIAARIVVSADKATGSPTPEWIRKLAEERSA